MTGQYELADESCALLYTMQVMHQRSIDVRYVFRYRVFSLLLDLGTLESAAKRCKLFSHNRFNLLSLYDCDHLACSQTDSQQTACKPGEGPSQSPSDNLSMSARGPHGLSPVHYPRHSTATLAAAAERLLQGQGISLDGGRVRLLCFPRILGLVFNPLSIWYCEGADGRLRAVICEVRNTFGERHLYLLHEHGRPMSWPISKAKPKQFHVSPFLDVGGHYRFGFDRPGDRISVSVNLEQQSRVVMTASMRGRADELSDIAVIRALPAILLNTLKVFTMIRWQALKLWLRGVNHRPKPPTPETDVT